MGSLAASSKWSTVSAKLACAGGLIRGERGDYEWRFDYGIRCYASCPFADIHPLSTLVRDYLAVVIQG